MGYRKVLVPVSGKYRLKRAVRALEHALQIVREDGEVCFLHCVHDVPQLITEEAHKRLILGAAGEAEKLLDRLAERVRNAGIEYCVHIVEGPPVTHIPSFASNHGCDVVVICSDGGDEMVAQQTIGGIAQSVFQYLSVPLFIVH